LILFLLLAAEAAVLKLKMVRLAVLAAEAVMEMTALLVQAVLVILHLQVHHKEILVVMETHLTMLVAEVVLVKLVILTKMEQVEMVLNHQ
jgi:hypothetical protein